MYLYLMVPLVQKELALYQSISNCQRIRKQAIHLPTRMSSNTAYSTEGKNCLLSLSDEELVQVDEWIQQIEQDHPRLLNFLSLEEETWAEEVYRLATNGLARPVGDITLQNVWQVFRCMTAVYEQVPMV